MPNLNHAQIRALLKRYPSFKYRLAFYKQMLDGYKKIKLKIKELKLPSKSILKCCHCLLLKRRLIKKMRRLYRGLTQWIKRAKLLYYGSDVYFVQCNDL